MDTTLDPPFAGLSAHPLAALAVRLQRAGVAGIEGAASIEAGELRLTPVTIASPGMRLVREDDMVCVPVDVPESVVGHIAGRPFSAVVSLPPCGDHAIDEAVRSMPVLEAARMLDQAGRPVLQIRLGRVPPVRVS